MKATLTTFEEKEVTITITKDLGPVFAVLKLETHPGQPEVKLSAEDFMNLCQLNDKMRLGGYKDARELAQQLDRKASTK